MMAALESVPRSIVHTLLFAIILAFGAACAHREPQAREGRGRFGNSITIKGSDTMVMPAQWWVENYLRLHPSLVIQVNGGGSGTGIAALLNGTTDICQSSRPIRERERAAFRAKHGRDLVEVKVALDAIGVYVHADNPMQAISLDEVRDIYTGRITDWADVGGARGKIILYSRENNSGTYEYFKEQALRNGDFAPRTQTLSGNSAVINAISHDRNGIGYGGIAFAKGVKALAIRKERGTTAISPDAAQVAAGAYPISRFLYWYLPDEPAGEIKQLIDWVTSDAGQALLKEVGFFPIQRTAL